MVGAVKRIQRAWRKRSLQKAESKSGNGTPEVGGSSNAGTSSRPMSAGVSVVGGPGGYEQLGVGGYRPGPGASGFSSELSLGYSSELTGGSSALYTATTASSLLSTPLSLSGYMSEVSGYALDSQQQQQQKGGGTDTSVGDAGGPGVADGSTAGSSLGAVGGLTLS
eukprot:GHUV01036288.1.p1 GENE.GHUV01036288.1~~GHUV01036288.1.p1  ORF type:complete len:166 (+),score=49.39 GHUV01036288.1:266-763(+)